MNKSWPNVKLGEVLTAISRPVAVKPDEIYREIGIRSHGKGVFHKEPISGIELGSKKVFWVEPGDFVLNIVFAWEGAVALISEAEAGRIGSHRFPTFRADPARLDLRFLLAYFKTPTGLELLGRVSPGGAGRNRTLSKTSFLRQEIPLPPLAEQRRIVARIEGVAEQIQEARSLRRQSAEETAALERNLARDLFPAPSRGLVSDWIRFQTGYAFKSEWFSETGIRLARNANVGHGTLDWSETALLPESRRVEFPRFELQAGDILITLDRPIISTGVKVARVRKEDLPCLLLQRVARAQFQSDDVSPEYFFRWLRSPHFTSAIDPGRSNGVPHISHKDIEKLPFAVPPLPEQRRIVAELDALQAEVDALKRLQAETAAELDALLPAILDQAFKGKL
ncbi:MAG TPA: hypothetical protein DDZ88_27930 [Verrucomicrobiales bacterium]|nr:hypothetical protein [Verrucomicrobiales bacterium]